MSEARLLVRFAGPHVSIQDAGRPGWARFGVPQSGAMDRLALRAANAALGNPPDAPVIEISRGGLQIGCEAGEIGFALAGGGFMLEHAGKHPGSWSRGILRAGESLAIRPGYWGNWCCLAFAGRLSLRQWLGSVATHGPSGLGGGILVAGTRLDFDQIRQQPDLAPRFPCPVLARPRQVLRVTQGPQERYFPAEALRELYEGPWRVTSAADRMGTRLRGPAIAPRAPLDMASEPLARGSVQVAGDGVATILTADHQTTGGYPRIATVLDCDLDAFAQTAPGRIVAFEPVLATEAVSLARLRQVAIARYLAGLSQVFR
ncbi:5-oxoprolinase subunit C family protein [Pseudogemmobacter bohemicus]|uniref:5-oxoprolinase subunit C family protein n=1 Tax=Pseudogemmobacter bohemicus TaxID=2250708 RepID=UPI000DD3BF10|nr:biotin-dependent carboxyltransferase family protein [Pseudogemmobacter bohemicus]